VKHSGNTVRARAGHGAHLLLQGDLNAETRRVHQIDCCVEIFESANGRACLQHELSRSPCYAAGISAEHLLVGRVSRLVYSFIVMFDD
jgi:hypothetical protein